jgi:DNA primase
MSLPSSWRSREFQTASCPLQRAEMNYRSTSSSTMRTGSSITERTRRKRFSPWQRISSTCTRSLRAGRHSPGGPSVEQFARAAFSAS